MAVQWKAIRRNMPKAPEFAEGWRLGKPDIIVDIVRDHRDPALKPLQAAIPLSNAKVRTPSGRARHHRDLVPALRRPAEPRPTSAATSPSATRSAMLGGARAAVVGVTGAAPARLAQYDEIDARCRSSRPPAWR